MNNVLSNLELMHKLRNVNSSTVNLFRMANFDNWDVYWNKYGNLHACLPHMNDSQKRSNFFILISRDYKIPNRDYENSIAIACTYKKGIDKVMDENKVLTLLNSLSCNEKISSLIESYRKVGNNFLNFINNFEYTDPILQEILGKVSEMCSHQELTSHGCFCKVEAQPQQPEKPNGKPKPTIRTMDVLKKIMGEK